MNSLFNFTVRNMFIFLAVIMLDHTSCGSLKSQQNSEINAVNLRVHWELVKIENGDLFNIDDSLLIVCYKNMVLCDVLLPGEKTITTYDKKDSVISQRKQTEIKHHYFIYNESERYGLEYDSLTDTPKKFLVDSLLKEKAFKDTKFVDKLNDSLVSKEMLNHVMVEKYIPKIKYDESYSDTTFLYYSFQLNGIDFTFSKELDSLKGMKLFKIRAVFNPIPKGKYSFKVPSREYLFEIDRYDINNRQEILSLFEKFKDHSPEG